MNSTNIEAQQTEWPLYVYLHNTRSLPTRFLNPGSWLQCIHCVFM